LSDEDGRRNPYGFFFRMFVGLIACAALCPAGLGRAVDLTEDIQLRIAEQFLAQGEFYRAVTEYKRFSILFPNSDRGQAALHGEAVARYLGGDYLDAAASWHRLRKQYPGSAMEPETHYWEGIALWKGGSLDSAVVKFETVTDFYGQSALAPTAYAARALVDLEGGDPLAAREHLSRAIDAYPADANSGAFRTAKGLVRRYAEMPEKSPGLAGTLSALLPGAGYFYARRPGDGVSAFLVNLLFVGATYELLRNENYVAGYLVGGFGIPFYLGNVYGSANAAKRWNLEIRKGVRDEISAVLHFAVDVGRNPD